MFHTGGSVVGGGGGDIGSHLWYCCFVNKHMFEQLLEETSDSTCVCYHVLCVLGFVRTIWFHRLGSRYCSKRPFPYLRFSYLRFQSLDFEQKYIKLVVDTSRDHLEL